MKRSLIVELRKKKLEDLFVLLQKKQNERLILEGKLTTKRGDSRMAYGLGFKGNLSNLKKDIARLKMIILEKQRSDMI